MRPELWPRARKHRPYPGQGYSLADAARDGVLLIVRCHGCQRPAIRYLASDLVAFGESGRWADEPPFPCSVCKTDRYIKVQYHHPSPGDYGHLTVRRPAGVRRTQLWKTVKLGD